MSINHKKQQSYTYWIIKIKAEFGLLNHTRNTETYELLKAGKCTVEEVHNLQCNVHLKVQSGCTENIS